MSEPRQLGIATEYLHMVEICRRRMAERGMTFDDLDRWAGEPKGYSAKVLGHKAGLPYHQHRFKFNQASFGPMMGALGIMWIAVEDQAAMAAVDKRSDRKLKTPTSQSLTLQLENPDVLCIFRQLGTLGARAANRRISKERKRLYGQMGARAMWRKRKWWVPRQERADR
jgi:hypothetical protein